MSDRLSTDAKKLVHVVDQLLAWMISSRPELEGSPQVTHVRKYADRLRESVEAQFDLDAALEDSAQRGRISDPEASMKAADVARFKAGTQKQKLAEVFFQYPGGLTAEEAVRIAGLSSRGSPWHRVSDLKAMGALRATGRERQNESGAEAEVLTMTMAAREAWQAKYGPVAPAAVLSIFGEGTQNV